MEAIKETVKSVIESLGAKKKPVSGDDPEALLKKILTKKELGHIKFNYFKKGIICANVDSSSWLYSLTLQKEDLLARLKQKNRAIKDVHFRIGEIK